MQTEGIEVKASPIERDRKTDGERQRETERGKEKQKEAKRNRERQRETERETERNRGTEKQKKRKKRWVSTIPTEFHLESKQKHENLK